MVAPVPVYADHAHGWNVFSGATGGYIVGFIAAAALTGFLAERRWDRRFSTAVMGVPPTRLVDARNRPKTRPIDDNVRANHT